jgi:hypothetical protein
MVVDDGIQPMLPFAIFILSQLSAWSIIFTFDPSCNTNKSTLDDDGELLTVMVGVIIMPSFWPFI